MTGFPLQEIALAIPALLLSLSVHEFAHAWVATRLGDRLPEEDGRLTLSPAAHIDWFGTLLFPILLLVTSQGGTFFGWAKPVRFNPASFRRGISMRRGAALTAIAGPLSNVALALVAIVVVRVLAEVGGKLPADLGEPLVAFAGALFRLNILLAVFNMMPLPPLDGSHLLPRSLDGLKEQLGRLAPVLFLVVFFLPMPGIGTLGGLVMSPLMRALEHVLTTVAMFGA